jgi:hypothetical protein
MIVLIREKRLYRFRLLFELYKRSDADIDVVQNLQDIATQLGIHHHQFSPAWKYLHMEELIMMRPAAAFQSPEFRYQASITHKGIKAIEEVFLNEHQPTYYFPSYREVMA